MTQDERAQLHSLLDETIDGEAEIVGLAVVAEVGRRGGEIKLRALLGQHSHRLREIVDQIRKR